MKGLLKSFVYAGSGIITCIRQERNMRVHLVCMIYMYSYLLIYDFFEVSRTQFAIIFIANAIVVMGELFNTAIEAVVDMAEEKFSEKYNRLAKISKDTAAGAVLGRRDIRRLARHCDSRSARCVQGDVRLLRREAVYDSRFDRQPCAELHFHIHGLQFQEERQIIYKKSMTADCHISGHLYEEKL